MTRSQVRLHPYLSPIAVGFAVSLSFAAGLGACGDDMRASGGCEADDECKGDRVCEDGECVDPGSGQSGSLGTGGATSGPSSGSGVSGEAIAATCNKLQSLGCPVPSFASYDACAAAFQQAVATCGDNADLTSYMACVQMYATCDPMTGEVIAYECFGAALNVSWCFGESSSTSGASAASAGSGAGGSTTSGAGGSYDGGTASSSGTGYGGYDGG